MFSKSVTFTDYDGVKQTKLLWFHLARKAAIKDITIADDIAAVERIVKGEKHELSTAEKQLILDFVIKILKMCYGERSDDGKRFKQTQETYEAFEETAAYDEFLTSLFVPNPEAAFQFILDAVPADVRAQVEAEASAETHAQLGQADPTTDVVASRNEEDELAAFQAWKASQVDR